MIYEFQYSDNRVLWIDTEYRRGTQPRVEILSGPTAGDHEHSIVQWQILQRQVGAWIGNQQPSWEYLKRQIEPAWIGDTVIRSRINAHPELTDQFDNFCKGLYDYILEVFTRCGQCESWRCNQPNVDSYHQECPQCQETVTEGNIRYIALYPSTNCYDSNTVNEHEVCDACYNQITEDYDYCDYDGRWVEADGNVRSTNNGEHYCQHHYERYWFVCEACSNECEVRDRIGDECHDCYVASGGCLCEECMPGQNVNRSVVRSWDYRPQLNFHPPVPSDPKKPLYIGMELETSFGQTATWREELNTWYEHNIDSNLIYIKSDSSVSNGVEIVTHPMEPDWALENFPFKEIDKLVSDLGALETHRSCGTHIHMNKEAFTTAHLWKFMHVHYRLPDFLRLLGGRQDNGFASFEGRDVQRMRADMMKIVKEKDKGQNYERYVAVNLRNQHTIELRYPASGTSSFLIKKNIELAKALFEFSDYLNVSDVKDGALDDPGYLMHWIRQGKRYPNLKKYMNSKLPRGRKLKARV